MNGKYNASERIITILSERWQSLTFNVLRYVNPGGHVGNFYLLSLALSCAFSLLVLVSPLTGLHRNLRPQSLRAEESERIIRSLVDLSEIPIPYSIHHRFSVLKTAWTLGRVCASPPRYLMLDSVDSDLVFGYRAPWPRQAGIFSSDCLDAGCVHNQVSFGRPGSLLKCRCMREAQEVILIGP